VGFGGVDGGTFDDCKIDYDNNSDDDVNDPEA
jgi:hypothetical protein